jgi:phosphotransferase system enzyme I (PtsI)
MAKLRTKIFKGIDASPGICVGHALLADRRRYHVPKTHVSDDQIPGELERFQDALEQSVTELESIRKKLSSKKGREPKAIIEAHLLIMQDQMLIEGTEKIIRSEAVNAEWALQKNINQIRKIFEAVEDDYFKERRSDVEFVGRRVMNNLMGLETSVNLPEHAVGVVMAHELSPGDTAGLNRQKVAGFVTEVGGKASHTAIVARSLAIPAVVGVEGILSRVGSGDRVIVDGYRGHVILHPSEKMVQEALARSRGLQDRAAELIAEKDRPAVTRDGHRVMLSANVEMVEEVPVALTYGAEAVGLFRTEFLFMGRRPPSEGFQRSCYKRILQQMGGRPVTIRTLDVGGDKRHPFLRAEAEANPALGLRSIRLSLRTLPLFITQLRALMRSSVDGQLKILFPMISCMRELKEAKEALEEAKAQLRAKGQAYDQKVKVGMMIEVPSAAFMSDAFAREVDFFSIGTNDLIQYTLAVDRQNEQVAYLYNPLHVSILRLLKQVIDNAHQAGITVAMCGEMAGDPLYVHVLLGLGLDEISMNLPALPYARHLVRASRLKEARQLTRTVLQMSDSETIGRAVRQWMADKFPDFFTPEGPAEILGGL